jgi:hypothetical protein
VIIISFFFIARSLSSIIWCDIRRKDVRSRHLVIDPKREKDCSWNSSVALIALQARAALAICEA